MIVKSLILGLLLAPLVLIAKNESGDKKINDKFDNIEAIIAAAEFNTASCQLHSTWHFPAELYAYLSVARHYADNYKKAKNVKKVHENLQNMLATVDECINGKNGYWSGNWNDVWVDPIPSVPDCALEAFMKMKEELEAEIQQFL